MLPASVKGFFLKQLLSRLQDGDKGSTLLGLICTAVLAAGVDFGALFGSDQMKMATEAAKIVAAVIIAAWGWKIGKKKQPAATPTP